MTEQSDDADQAKQGFFSRIRSGLGKTREKLAEGIGRTFLGEKVIDEELLEELETLLLSSDFGIEATDEVIGELTRQVARKELSDGQALYDQLQQSLVNLLKPVEQPLTVSNSPFVMLMVGVNGAGKTTTAGKLAKRFQDQGHSVMLAAGDTFRAAAVEQLTVWGERNNVPVIAQGTGADSASVIFDAMVAAKARGTDVLIADTAGRLQNKKNLMDELSKINRVLARHEATAPHAVVLVLDAGTGQNALSQAAEFLEAVDVTGLVLTKLDGTAKGGVIFAIARKFGLPIHFIGVGEGVDDLQPFVAEDFVTALLDRA